MTLRRGVLTVSECMFGMAKVVLPPEHRVVAERAFLGGADWIIEGPLMPEVVAGELPELAAVSLLCTVTQDNGSYRLTGQFWPFFGAEPLSHPWDIRSFDDYDALTAWRRSLD